MKKQSEKLFISGNINHINTEAYNEYIKYCNLKGLSDETLSSYTYDMLQWFRFIGNKTYKEIQEEDIQDYLEFCKLHGNNESRLQRRCSSISSFYLYLRRKRIVSHNPLEFIDRPVKKLDVRKKIYLSENQIFEIKEKVKLLNDIRIEVYILLSITSAGRINALNNIKWEDIDWDEREIIVIEKGPKEATLVFSEEVKYKLLELKQFYKNNKYESEYVFITYTKEVRQASKAALRDWCHKAGSLIDVPKLHPHAFRRSTATLLKSKGVPLEDISELLNHNDTKTTQIYLKKDKNKIKKLKDRFEI